MRKGKLLIFTLLVTLCMGFTRAYAQDLSLLQVHSLDATATPQETVLTEISKLVFTTAGFDIHLKNDAQVKNFKFADVNRITFKMGSSGVQETVKADLQVNPNPVQSMLNITGYDENQEYQLAIYTLTGQEILRVNNWKGETIDVSGYAAGIYLININTTTIKFIKL